MKDNLFLSTTLPTEKRQYNSLDLLKYVAALFVVMFHSEPFSGTTKVVLTHIIGRPAVPLFFIMSAYFFFSKPATSERLRHYLLRMCQLYLFWFIVELPTTILHSFIEPSSPPTMRVLLFLRGLLFGSTFYGSWFLNALIICVPLITILSRRLNNTLLFFLGFFLFGYASISSLYIGLLPIDMQNGIITVNAIIGMPQLNPFTAFIYVVAGKYFAEHKSLLSHKSLGLLSILFYLFAATEVLVVENITPVAYVDEYFMLLPLSCCIFLYVKDVRLEWNFDFVRLRHYSTIYYFSHFIFVFIFVVINKHFVPINPILKYIMVVCFCTLLASLMLKLSTSRRFSWIKRGY